MSKDLRAQDILREAVTIDWQKVEELVTEEEYDSLKWNLEDDIEFDILDCLKRDDYDPEIENGE